MKITLCVNCLERTQPGVSNNKETYHHPETKIGDAIGGDQRDPEYALIDLCRICKHALQHGIMNTFHNRYRESVAVNVKGDRSWNYPGQGGTGYPDDR